MTAPRPKQHLIAAGKRYPGAWRQVDNFRADRGKGLPSWPDWCYLPLAGAYSIVSEGGEMPTHLLLDVGRLGALIAWRVTQGIYRFDPALYPAIIDTPVDREIPCEVLYHLPEWCLYIETPDLAFNDSPLQGFFAHLEYDINTQRHELRLLLDAESGLVPLPIHLGPWPLNEALERAQAESLRQGVITGRTQLLAQMQGKNLADLAGDIAPLISLLLYVCSQSSEIGTPEHRPSNPEPKRTKHGWRLFAAEKTTTWDVGVRIGAALRSAYQRAETGSWTDQGGDRSRPRAHVRRAHWHGYWMGSKEPERAAERRFDLRWMPPIPVNVESPDELPSVIHEVKHD